MVAPARRCNWILTVGYVPSLEVQFGLDIPHISNEEESLAIVVQLVVIFYLDTVFRRRN